MIGRSGARYVDPSTVLRLYKLLKSNPKKIFTSQELFLGQTLRNRKVQRHVNLLKNLDILEEVETYYTFHNGGRKRIRGFRYARKEISPKENI